MTMFECELEPTCPADDYSNFDAGIGDGDEHGENGCGDGFGSGFGHEDGNGSTILDDGDGYGSGWVVGHGCYEGS
jgi:hypothetical protein